MKLKLIVMGAVALAAVGAFAAGKGSSEAKSTDLKWAPTPNAPPGGPQAAVVWGDPVKGPVGFFLKLQPGSDSGVHSHASDYRGVVVKGAITDTETDDKNAEGLPAGSYYFQPGKQLHNNICKGTEECILYVEMVGGIDFIPAAKTTAKK